MAAQGNSTAGRLEAVARTFASLAEAHTQKVTSNTVLNTSILKTTIPCDTSNGSFQSDSTSSFSSLPESLESDFSGSLDLESCPDSLLNWFLGTDIMTPGETTTQDGVILSRGDSQVERTMNQSAQAANNTVPSYISGYLENKGNKRPLECTFDWFSWDMHNAKHQRAL
jgi:hypothetical protein